MADSTITDLAEVVASLPPEERALFQRIYAVATKTGELRIPQDMESWAIKQFGSLEAIARQKIVRVTNLVTDEEVLFNELRSLRPFELKSRQSLEAELAGASENDVFRTPVTSTPEDLFGRAVGKHCVTASNVAKNDWLHGVVIFNDFNPFLFTKEKVIDYIDTGWEWARHARQLEPEAKYLLLFWNCLWRAGASLVHGHAQVMLASERHYTRIESLRRAALSYKQQYNSNYFNDLFRVHQALNCAMTKDGVKIITYLTPFKYNEIILMSEELNLPLKEVIYQVLAFLRDKLHVVAFNLGLITPPLAPTKESWEGFPVIARIIDRGDPENRVSDVGSIEIFGANVVVGDPFKLARQLWEYLG